MNSFISLLFGFHEHTCASIMSCILYSSFLPSHLFSSAFMFSRKLNTEFYFHWLFAFEQLLFTDKMFWILIQFRPPFFTNLGIWILLLFDYLYPFFLVFLIIERTDTYLFYLPFTMWQVWQRWNQKNIYFSFLNALQHLFYFVLLTRGMYFRLLFSSLLPTN